MTRRLVILAVLTLIASLAAGGQSHAADPPQWTVDPVASRLVFIGSQGGSPFEGRFERFTADIRFDPANPATQRIAIVIDMASAQSGNRERDATVRDADWFAVAQHPVARFETMAIRSEGEGRYRAQATLTIRGISRPVELPFTLGITEPVARAHGEVTIDRVDFGVGQGPWATGDMVGRAVTIRFEITARRNG
jgi:polyisoprenoid-binding protein YceI